MNSSITYVGIDVHKKTYSVCSFNLDDDAVKFQTKFEANVKNLLKYLERIRESYPTNTKFICGYEAGFCGYSLYKELEKYCVECWILAPSTMEDRINKRIKTDKRDAANIAKNMAYNQAERVYVLDTEDEGVKEYIRMRDDHKRDLKATKQHILALLNRQGISYKETKPWTHTFMTWLKKVELENKDMQDTLDEYLITYHYLEDKLKRFDRHIEEISMRDRYRENSYKLQCFLGIKTHTAMSFLSEIGDFKRFRCAHNFSSFLGLVPSEHSSGEKIGRGAITKCGNKHLRTLLTEAAQCYSRGQIGYKSKELLRRQSRCTKEVIAYADKANERLRRRFYHLVLHRELKHNVAKSAIARELSCFMWGMMTDNIKVA